MNYNKTYYVFFRDGENWFQRRFLKNGFGHIFLMTKMNGNWLIIDPLTDFLNITGVNLEDDGPKRMAEKTNSLCIMVTVEQDFTKVQEFNIFRTVIPRFISCVGIVKYILGVKCSGLTPYSFYKQLLKKEIGYGF